MFFLCSAPILGQIYLHLGWSDKQKLLVKIDLNSINKKRLEKVVPNSWQAVLPLVLVKWSSVCLNCLVTGVYLFHLFDSFLYFYFDTMKQAGVQNIRLTLP